MQCNNCGTQLAEGEITCPRCGTPVDGISQPYTAIKNEIPQQVQPQPTAVEQSVPKQEAKEKTGNGRKVLIFLIVVTLIALLAVMFYSVVLTETPNENNIPTNKDEPQKEKTITQDYGGYTFTIPEGYQYKISELYGLIIFNESEAYSIMVDYTNPYETRKATYIAQFPNQAANLITTVSNKEFTTLLITTPTGGFATQYATITSEKNSSFIGLVVRSDYQNPTAVELANLAQILESATQSAAITPGSANDAGTIGIQVYTVDFNAFFTPQQQ